MMPGMIPAQQNTKDYQQHKKYFDREDQRKDRLWSAIEHFIVETYYPYLTDPRDEYTETYDGLVSVHSIHDKCLQILLCDDGDRLTSLRVPSEIQANARKDDMMHVEIGRKGKKWHIIDVISIGSQITAPASGGMVPIHFSVNPRLMNKPVI